VPWGCLVESQCLEDVWWSQRALRMWRILEYVDSQMCGQCGVTLSSPQQSHSQRIQLVQTQYKTLWRMSLEDVPWECVLHQVHIQLLQIQGQRLWECDMKIRLEYAIGERVLHRETLLTHSTSPDSGAKTLATISKGEVGGWGRVPFSRNLMSPTPRRKWYLKTGRRAH